MKENKLFTEIKIKATISGLQKAKFTNTGLPMCFPGVSSSRFGQHCCLCDWTLAVFGSCLSCLGARAALGHGVWPRLMNIHNLFTTLTIGGYWCQVGSKREPSCKRFELIDWEDMNFRISDSRLFISPLQKRSGGYSEGWAGFPEQDWLTDWPGSFPT